jgi:hypothetical protein
MKPRRKTFVCAAKSTNYNAFGLRGCVLIANDGDAWQVAANSLNEPEVGERLSVPLNELNGNPMFHGFGYEIPERLPNAPENIVTGVFSSPDPNDPQTWENERRAE